MRINASFILARFRFNSLRFSVKVVFNNSPTANCRDCSSFNSSSVMSSSRGCDSWFHLFFNKNLRTSGTPASTNGQHSKLCLSFTAIQPVLEIGSHKHLQTPQLWWRPRGDNFSSHSLEIRPILPKYLEHRHWVELISEKDVVCWGIYTVFELVCT